MNIFNWVAKAYLLLLLVLPSLQISSRPSFIAYHGVDHLNKASFTGPDENGNLVSRHELDFQDPTGKSIQLSYDLHHASNEVVSLDQELSILAVQCLQDDLITISINSNSSESQDLIARLKSKDTLLAGSRLWGCSFASDRKPSTIMRRVQKHIDSISYVELTEPNGEIHVVDIRLQVAACHLHDFFVNGKVRFSSSVFYSRDIQYPNYSSNKALYSQLRAVEVERELDGWWSDFFDYVWSGVKHLANNVQKVVEDVVLIVKAFSGNIDGEKDMNVANISWNFDPDTQDHVQQEGIRVDETATCQQCYLNIDATLHMDIDISNFELEQVSVYFMGNAETHINASIQASDLYFNATDVVLAVKTFKPIIFYIGPVPIELDITVPVHAGYNYTVDVLSSVQAYGYAKGNVKYGFKYTSSNGFQFIHNHAWIHEGLVNHASLGINANVQFYLMPVLVVHVDCIGSVNVGLKPFIEPSLQYQSIGSPCNPNGTSGSIFKLDWGLQLTIGASLNITVLDYHVYDRSFGPYVAFSMKWPLTHGCLAFESGPNLFEHTPPLFFVGMSYSGVLVFSVSDPLCSKLSNLSVPITFQLVQLPEPTSGYPMWVGAGNHNWNVSDYNVACVSQIPYLANGGMLEVFQPPGVDPTFKNCTLDAQGYALLNLGGSYGFSQDLSQLTINTGSPCIGSFTLTRSSDTIKRNLHLYQLDALKLDYHW